MGDADADADAGANADGTAYSWSKNLGSQKIACEAAPMDW